MRELWTWQFSWKRFRAKSCESDSDKRKALSVKLFCCTFINKNWNIFKVRFIYESKFLKSFGYFWKVLPSRLILSLTIQHFKAKFFIQYEPNWDYKFDFGSKKKLSQFEGNLWKMFVRSLATDMIFFCSKQKLVWNKTFQFSSTRFVEESLCKKTLASSANKNEARKFNIFQFNQIS